MPLTRCTDNVGWKHESPVVFTSTTVRVRVHHASGETERRCDGLYISGPSDQPREDLGENSNHTI